MTTNVEMVVIREAKLQAYWV